MQENILLKHYTTLRLGGAIRYFFISHNDTDIRDAVTFARSKDLPILPLGEGSNMVVSDTLSDIVCVKLENKGIRVMEENTENVLVHVPGGEKWDHFVSFCVEHCWVGVEMLSAIPGTVGASPVQNIGAYGGEVSGTIQSVRGYNIETGMFENISNAGCKFGYRDSIFKHEFKGKFIIESVIFKLSKKVPQVPQYPLVDTTLASVQAEFPDASLLQNIRTSIQRIRANKLPDPRLVANVGSFFKNVFVSEVEYQRLAEKSPDMPVFKSGEQYKIPAGWLIEKAGYKGYRVGDVGVYDKNALVLVNHTSEKASDIFSLAETIRAGVSDKFGLELTIEPEIII